MLGEVLQTAQGSNALGVASFEVVLGVQVGYAVAETHNLVPVLVDAFFAHVEPLAKLSQVV